MFEVVFRCWDLFNSLIIRLQNGLGPGFESQSAYFLYNPLTPNG